MREISGDSNTLTRGEKLWYLLYNLGRGVWGYRVWQKTLHYKPHRPVVNSSDSPGRQYIDLFLADILPQYVAPGTLRVLDVGCGSGYIRSILTRIGYRGTYTGVDVSRDAAFDTSPDVGFKSTFWEAKIEACKISATFDLVISNTALEHIENDRLAITQCTMLAGSGIQLHIMPSFWSLFLYLLHGYRQYTPARLSYLFGGQRYITYRIGGLGSFLLHFFYCTIPERLTASDRLRRKPLYPKLVRMAFLIDRYVPVCSMFYAVVVLPYE